MDAILNGLAVYFSWQLFIGLFFLVVYSLNNFDRWSDLEIRLGKESAPRHYTTQNRYSFYAILYTLTCMLIYVVLLAFPSILSSFAESFHIGQFQFPQSQIVRQDFPLVLLLTIIAVFPSVPLLREGEARLRTWFHRQAFIPSQAAALVARFVNDPDIFLSDPREHEEILSMYGVDIPEGIDPTTPKQSLWHKWFKLLYFRKKISQWRETHRTSQFNFDFGRTYIDMMPLFDEISRNLHEYRRKMDMDPSAEKAGDYSLPGGNDGLPRKINSDMDRLLQTTYEYICCGILSTTRSEGVRREQFAFFGLYPKVHGQMPFVADSVLAAMFFVFTITTLTTLHYHLKANKPINVISAMDIGLLHMFMQGVCICLAYHLYRKFRMAGWFNELPRRYDFFVPGRLVRVVICTATGYCFVLLILLAWRVAHANGNDFARVLAESWFWPLPVAVTTAFVTYYLQTMKTNDISFMLHGGIQAVVQGGIGALVASLHISLHNNSSMGLKEYLTSPFLFYIFTTLFLTGWCIGFVFPYEYSKALRANRFERRGSKRVTIDTAYALVGERQETIKGAEVSSTGAGLALEAPLRKGSSLDLEIPGFGALKARVRRKAAGKIFLAFGLSGIDRRRLDNFLSAQTSE